jgi:uncharacterized protein (DUF433 family)
MHNSEAASFIRIDPEIQGGTPCFAGTRVPVKSLFEALERGRSVDYFLEQFPTVNRQQVTSALKLASELVASPAAGHAA